MTTNRGLRPVQKAVQGVFLAYLYIQVIQVCTACAAIYCRASYTSLIQLSVQRISCTAVHTLRKVCQPYTSRLLRYKGDVVNCFRCGGTRIEFRRTIMQNGQTSIGAYCLQCNRLATKETCIPKRRFSAGQIADMVIEHDYSQHDNVCCVKGCTRHDVEWHHFAPRGLFNQEADDWPGGWLCAKHHREWHERTKTGAFSLRG